MQRKRGQGIKSGAVKVEFCFPSVAVDTLRSHKLATTLLKEIKRKGNVGRAGYRDEEGLHNALVQGIDAPVGRRCMPLTASHRRRIALEITKTVVKLRRELPLSLGKPFIFVFPWFPKGRDAILFGGVNAATPHPRVMHLFIDPETYTSTSLRETVAHEWSHLAFYQAHRKRAWTLGDHLAMEGLAEHFREDVVGGKPAPWSRALKKKEAERAWRALTPLLGSKSRKLYNEVFFGGKRFKRWAGYSIGHRRVGNFLKRYENFPWKVIIERDVKNILMLRPVFLFVGGVNGSGKSTVLSLLARKNKFAEVVRGSSFFMNWLGIRDKNYKKLRTLPDRFVLREQEKMIDFLVHRKHFKKEVVAVFLDAHFVNIRKGKAQEWIGDWFRFFDGAVLVEATSSEILTRMEKDSERDRDIFPFRVAQNQKPGFIALFLKESEYVFKKYTDKHGIPCIIVKNNQGKIYKSSAKITSFLKKNYIHVAR